MDEFEDINGNSHTPECAYCARIEFLSQVVRGYWFGFNAFKGFSH